MDTESAFEVLIGDDKMRQECGLDSTALEQELSRYLTPLLAHEAETDVTIRVHYYETADEVEAALAGRRWDFVALDNNWECDGRDRGFSIAHGLRTADGPNKDTPLCIFTQHSWLQEVENIDRVFSLDGALSRVESFADFFPKPERVRFDSGVEWLQHFAICLLVRMKACFLLRCIRQEFEGLNAALVADHGLVGNCRVFRELIQKCQSVSRTDASVLLTGGTGTGKEVLAKYICALHPRRSKEPFIKVKCAEVPEDLFEGLLFGHDKGVFTGAVAQRKGRIAEADGGTIFFDEIDHCPLAQQPKLLTFLEEREITPLGLPTEKVNARVIAAACDLEKKVRAGEFLEELYHRLQQATIRVPSLDERREDVPLLANYFLREHRNIHPETIAAEITPLAMEELCKRTWPGNIRELKHTIERAAFGEESTQIDADRVLKSVLTHDEERGAKHTTDRVPERKEGETVRAFMQRYLRWEVEQLLRKHASDPSPVTMAANELGYSPPRFSEIARQQLGMNAQEWLLREFSK